MHPLKVVVVITDTKWLNVLLYSDEKLLLDNDERPGGVQWW